MDWNQISNYAAKHTHTKLGLGEARASGRSAQDSRGRGAQSSVKWPSARPGPLARGCRLSQDPERRAPREGWGKLQVGLSRWDSAPGPGAAGGGLPRYRPGRTFRPCCPLLSAPSCPSLNRGPHSAPGSPPSAGLSLRAVGFARGPCGWAPDCRTLTQTSGVPHSQKHAPHTHAHARPRSYPPSAPLSDSSCPAAHTAAISLLPASGG